MPFPLFRSVFAVVLFIAAEVSAQTIPVPFNASDAKSYDGWVGLNGTNYAPTPNYGGSFPGAMPWLATIGSNTPSSGDADFTKTSGNGYPASDAIYAGGFDSMPNSSGGAFSISDATVLAAVKTIVFQIQIGEAFGYDFFNHAAPALALSGSASGLAPAFSGIISRFQNGTFTDPNTGIEQPVYVNTWGFQWNVGGVATPITSLAVNYTAVQHSQTYQLQLDQSDRAYTTSLVVPEPSALVFLSSGLAAWLSRRRRA